MPQRNGKDPLASLLKATAARKRGNHSALAQKLLKECRIDQADIMFCRGPDGHLVQLGAGAYGQVSGHLRGGCLRRSQPASLPACHQFRRARCTNNEWCAAVAGTPAAAAAATAG